MKSNNTVIWYFVYAQIKEYRHWINLAENFKRLPYSRSLGIHFANKFPDIRLVSNGKTIAIRRACKSNDCNPKPNRLCVNYGRCWTAPTFLPKIAGVRFIVCNKEVTQKNIKDAKQRNITQKHIKELINLLKSPLEEDVWEAGGVHMHPSLLNPIVEFVDCWADEVNY